MFSFTAANEEVENLVVEMYNHFDKIMTETDPLLFSDILPLTGTVLEKLDNAILKVKDLEKMLQINESEKENIIDVLSSTKIEQKKYREELAELQLEVDTFRCQNTDIGWEHEQKRLEKEIIDLNYSLKLKSKEALTLQSEFTNLNKKYSKLQNLYTDLTLEHSSLTQVNRLLEEDIATFYNNKMV